MEEHSALGVTTSELIVAVIPCVIFLAVAIASYRRCRCLSRHPIWKSLFIAALAGIFVFPWLIAWWVNREQLVQEWRDYRASQLTPAA